MLSSRRELLKYATLLPTVSGLLPGAAAAQQAGSPVQSEWLKEIAAQLQKEFHLPAVWVAVDIDGAVEAAVVGVKKMGNPTPAALDDLLTVASVSKPIAGLWIATLVDSGKLTYETKVLDVLPELQSICLPEHRGVTLGQLLTHTAGVARDATHIPSKLTLEQYPAERLREAKEILSLPAPPDSKGKEFYSNNGVTLAVSMAERVAGEPYETAVEHFYRERLGLKSLGVWAMNLSDDLTLPWPHSMKDESPVPQPPRTVQFQFVRPSGSAHCTITDLVKFGLIATNASPTSKSILKPETWTRFLAPVAATSATVSSFHAYGERANFGHAGSLGTTSTNMLVFPEWKVSLAIHTNASGDVFRDRGTQILQDAIRKQLAKRNPPPPCSIRLTGVAPMDASWQKEIIPKHADDKLRVRVQFEIRGNQQTGDLQTLVKLGDVERRDNRFRGLRPGNHTLHFEFDPPKNVMTSALVMVDALGTAGNRTPDAALFRSVLTVGN